MRNHLKMFPNQLTAGRLVLLAVMWLFALLKLPVYVGIGMILSFVTDVLDGYVARKLSQVSAFGSKFDSLVDNLILPSALIWLWLFRPEIYQENLVVGAIAIIVYFSALLLGMVKFRRFANLHLYFSKFATVCMYVFISHALIAKNYSPALFYLALGTFLVMSLENLLLQLVCSEVDEHMGSLLLVLKNRKSG